MVDIITAVSSLDSISTSAIFVVFLVLWHSRTVARDKAYQEELQRIAEILNRCIERLDDATSD